MIPGMNPIDPAALDCLVALADTGSFERAAQQLAVTQSAVSQRLRSLESELGRLLVVRARPLRLTDAGKLLLRHARRWQALRADMSLELDATLSQHEHLPIAVNADSLATWVLPALDEEVRTGLGRAPGVELIVDDQDFTHEALREGTVLGCISTVAQALRGCSVAPLGRMRYLAVASPAFIAAHLPQGLNRRNFSTLPWLVFNRKDDMAAAWVAQAFGLRGPRLRSRTVPSTEAHLRATLLGWGIAVLPELMAAEPLSTGHLQVLHPQVWIDVQLHWHQWSLQAEPRSAATHAGGVRMGAGALDRIGQALVQGAARALRPA